MLISVLESIQTSVAIETNVLSFPNFQREFPVIIVDVVLFFFVNTNYYSTYLLLPLVGRRLIIS